MRDLSTTLCRRVARQVIASMPLQERLQVPLQARLPGLPVPVPCASRTACAN